MPPKSFEAGIWEAWGAVVPVGGCERPAVCQVPGLAHLEAISNRACEKAHAAEWQYAVNMCHSSVDGTLKKKI